MTTTITNPSTQGKLLGPRLHITQTQAASSRSSSNATSPRHSALLAGRTTRTGGLRAWTPACSSPIPLFPPGSQLLNHVRSAPICCLSEIRQVQPASCPLRRRCFLARYSLVVTRVATLGTGSTAPRTVLFRTARVAPLRALSGLPSQQSK